jgi:hypothetical protein
MMTGHVNLQVSIELAGISLALSARISDQALQAAFAETRSAVELSGSPSAMQELDHSQLLSVAQQGLSQAMQSLRENLALQALTALQLKVAESIEGNKGFGLSP